MHQWAPLFAELNPENAGNSQKLSAFIRMHKDKQHIVHVATQVSGGEGDSDGEHRQKYLVATLA